MPLAFVNTKTLEPNTLRFQLHKALKSRRAGRDLSRLHASDMTKEPGFCPRQRLIMQIIGMKPPDEWTSASQQMVYDLGNAVEEIIIKRAIGAGLAVGDWQCFYCKTSHSMRTCPDRCTSCGKPDGMRYNQRRFYSQKSGISCGIDLLVRGLGPKYRIVEVKTMQKDDFRKLVMPLAEHRLRTNLYMRIVDEAGDKDASLIDTKTASVIYVDKGGFGIKDPEVETWKIGDKGFSPFKEFTVYRNDNDTDIMSKLGARYLEAKQTQTICGGVCSHQSESRAMKCNVGERCWNGTFPVGEKF